MFRVIIIIFAYRNTEVYSGFWKSAISKLQDSHF